MRRLPLVSPVDRALFLRAQPYLENASSSVLVALSTYTEECFYRAGTSIRDPGAAIERIIFLGQGCVELSNSERSDEVYRTIDAPGAIGLAHHFASKRRPPAVRAKTDTLCLEIRADDLDQILEDDISLLLQMAQTTCHQVAITTKSLAELRPKAKGFSQTIDQHTPARLDHVARLARLKQVPFLAGTNLGVLGELARFDPPRHLLAGEMLWCEGDAIDRMVVVLDGQFQSIGPHGTVSSPAGSVIGAWELFLDEPRFEGWVAEIPSRVISIGRDIFIDVFEDHFEFAQTYLGRASSHLIDGWDALARQYAPPGSPRAIPEE